MHKAYLMIGGNQGDRLAQLKHAREMISRQVGDVLQASAVYETAPWGLTNQPAFLNQALLVQTSLAAKDLLVAILGIEVEMGRRRREKMGPRLIDIDILFFDQEIIRKPELMVPHPEMQNRRFVLLPLEEIAAEQIHPVFQKSVARLLDECADQLDVKKI